MVECGPSGQQWYEGYNMELQEQCRGGAGEHEGRRWVLLSTEQTQLPHDVGGSWFGIEEAFEKGRKLGSG